MPASKKILSIRVNAQDHGYGGCKVFEVCREISVKEICEDCERTTLYPEENCGQPATFVVCEEVTKDCADSSSKTRLPEAGL